MNLFNFYTPHMVAISNLEQNFFNQKHKQLYTYDRCSTLILLAKIIQSNILYLNEVAEITLPMINVTHITSAVQLSSRHI